MQTPVALIVFNRPEATARLVSSLAGLKPRRLFVIADGPRDGHSEDAEKCAATRAVIDRIDWDCELVKDYSPVNLGCGKRPHTGISRLFEQTDRAVILEDDCVPEPTAFPFFEELLERYRDDERVMHISGRSVFPDGREGPYSYYFTRSLSCWGWATWARAWRSYDYRIAAWPELRDSPWLEDVLGDRRAVPFFRRLFDSCHAHADHISYWDQQWNFACWANSGLGIRPYVNLIANTGFGAGATHDVQSTRLQQHYAIPARPIGLPLHHPPRVLRDVAADRYAIDAHFTAMAPELARQRARRFLRFVQNRARRLLTGRARGGPAARRGG